MRFFTLAILLLSAINAVGEELHGCSFYSTVDQKSMVAEVSRDQLARAPVWPPEADNPPLPARRAIELARKQMELSVADRSVWRLESVQLLDMGDHLHWMYLVQFMRQFPDDVAVFGDFSLQIPVLMDGAVISLRPKDGEH